MKRILKFFKRIVLILFFGHLIYIIALKWINPPITITQFNSWIDGHGLKKSPISFAEMPSSIKLAVIASEDQKFAIHNGFDVEHMKKAIEFNEKNQGEIGRASCREREERDTRWPRDWSSDVCSSDLIHR